MIDKIYSNVVVIFGGAGFIGQHFASYLLDNKFANKVLLADIKKPKLLPTLIKHVDSGEVEFSKVDVRNEIELDLIVNVSLVCNFAAVHREPGHEQAEYYNTNIPGAENVCKWADKVACKNIIFTSSIAPYGPTEVPKDEATIPVPVSAYGGSKLAAEKIHQIWQSQEINSRKLAIVRPGVVFGAGEGGNVSRLIKAVLNRYFFYMGNKDTRKAGIYVKELCFAMWWVINQQKEGVCLFNMSMNPGPTVEEYVNVICDTAKVKRRVANVPFYFLYIVSLVIDPVAKLCNIKQPISPVRLRKLVKSNNIIAQTLRDMGYTYQFTFAEAMADWKKDSPKEW